MRLNEQERRTLNGEYGEANRLCLQIEVELGEAYGVERLIPITGAHIDANSYGRVSGEAKLAFAQKIVHAGGKVSVPTTLNPGGRDISRWRKFRIPEEFAAKCELMENAYLKMGAIPTWTCTPYTYGTIPCRGEQIAYAESNAISFANSVLGARTPRYGDFLEVCAAITGRAPYFDLHRDENRFADLWFHVEDPRPYSFSEDLFYSLLGYHIGGICGGQIPVVTGIPAGVNRDSLKNFSAAVASSGGVGLFHIVGVTPEAPDLESVTTGEVREDRNVVTGRQLLGAEEELTGCSPDDIDLVLLGCPHASVREFQMVLAGLAEKKVADGVEFWIQTNRGVYSWIEEMGILDEIKGAGVKVSTDSCLFNWPLDNWEFERAVTNSAKFAHYAPNELDLATAIRDIDRCVRAAVTGEIEGSGLE